MGILLFLQLLVDYGWGLWDADFADADADDGVGAGREGNAAGVLKKGH